jgi:hypothetical protein
MPPPGWQFPGHAVIPKKGQPTLAYAVSYLQAEADRTDLQLNMGSNDQGKVYLNGKVLPKTSEPRTLEEDSDILANRHLWRLALLFDI